MTNETYETDLVAQPNGISVWKLKEYVPPKDEPVRPGAQDAFKILSRGF